ncbi:hypothetical protein Tco_0591782 [Tanacetum coccineum]
MREDGVTFIFDGVRAYKGWREDSYDDGTIVNVESARNSKNVADGVNRAGAMHAGNKGKGIETTGPRCFNCKGIGHIGRNYIAPLRKRNSKFYKEITKSPSGIFIATIRENESDTENEKKITYDEENGTEQQSDATNFYFLTGSVTDDTDTKLHLDLAHTTQIDIVQQDGEIENTNILSEVQCDDTLKHKFTIYMG